MIASFLSGSTTAHHAVLNKAISAGKNPGLFAAPTIEVIDGQLQIGPNSGLFEVGVVYEETSTSIVDAGTFGSAAVVKTIAWQIDEQLFSQPELIVIDGMSSVGFSKLHVVLGWIFYPGGGLTLTNEMVVAAPIAVDARIIRLKSSNEVSSDLISLVDPAMVSSSYADLWTRIASTTSVTRTWRYAIEANCDASPIGCISIDASLSAQASLRTYIKRFGKTEELVVDGSINGQVEKSTWLIPLLRHKVKPWERFMVYFDFILGVGSSAEIGSIKLTNETIATLQKR